MGSGKRRTTFPPPHLPDDPYFCPSCQAKRVAAFVEWVTEEVLEAVDHRQYVWTLPRVLRPAFRKERKLLGRLSRCAWISLRQYAQAALGEGFVPGAVVAIQTYGDALNPHEHIHMLASDSAWRPDGGCGSLGEVDSEVLTRLFQHQVLEAMVAERRLSHDFAQKLRSWHPSGFGVHRGRSIECDDRPALERLAAYLLRPSFAASRLQYDPEEGRIEYRTSKGLHRTLDALDWIALVTSHIPNRGEQMSRYYGRYSNASRGSDARPAPRPRSRESPRPRTATSTPPPSASPSNGGVVGRGCYARCMRSTPCNAPNAATPLKSLR